MTTLPPPPPWETVRNALPAWKYGVEGSWNLVRLAATALNALPAHPGMPALATGMLLWATQTHPLHRDLAAMRQSLARLAGDSPPGARLRGEPLFTTLASKIHPVDGLPACVTSFAPDSQASRDALLAFLREAVRDPRHCLFWLGLGFETLMDAGAWDHVAVLLDTATDLIPRPLGTRLRAEWALTCLDPTRAASAVSVVDATHFGLWKRHAQARLALAVGDAEGARHALAGLWRAIPWHVNAALTLHDLTHPLPAAPDDATAGTCIMLYSWNKAEPLRATLSSLLASELGGARILVLDNGSTDATPQVIEAASAASGGRIRTITLPVNVGAPAARNWLLAQPEAHAAAYAAFLDDDIVLPTGWLRELLDAAAAHPRAGAVGCRITDHTPPHCIQAADFHAIPPDMGAPGFADFPEQVHILNSCIGIRDNGLFSYTRPCLSVTGCCHLLRMDAVRAAGPFDVRFSPSQFDDLERDIRSTLHGWPTVYHGRLRVGHMQHSSLRQAATPAKSAHIFGNKLKLEHLYTPEEARTAREANATAVWDDLAPKLHRLEEAYPASAATDNTSLGDTP